MFYVHRNRNKPLVSIVVPSYQQGHFIEDTLRSILNQDYSHIEVVVVDGASTDDTLAVLERYSDRISYMSEPDKGQSDAINKGFRMVRGEIVTWLNSDDIYPDRRAVSRIVDAFQQHPGSDLIYGDFIEIDSNNRIQKIYKRPGFSFERLLRIGYISQPATFFRRRVIDRMAVREDLTYAMDLEYWLRAFSMHFRFRHIDFLIAAERLHEGAKCVKDTKAMAAEARDVRSKHGGKFDCLFPFFRFVDRLLLYALRIPGILDLARYRRHPDWLTVPLDFDGAIKRTILFHTPLKGKH